MRRRELLRGAALTGLGSVAAGLLAPQLAQAEQAEGSGEAARALAELQRALDQLEAAFATPAWNLRTAADFAEARRMTLHVLLHGLQAWLEADPGRPFFTSFIDPHKKMLGDNPDARYYSAVISDRYRYRIRGNLAGATYTSFTVELGAGVDGDGIGSTLNDSEFESDADGNYEITLSAEKVPGNWMPLPRGATSLTSRHYFERKLSINNDPLHQIPLAIGNLDPMPPRQAPSDADIAAGIRRVTRFVQGNVVPMNNSQGPAWVSRVPNTFAPPQQDGSNESITYAARDNVYAMAPFLLQPQQALVIRGRFPRCRFSNLVLFNRFLQTLDYETRTISRNRAQTVQDADGNFEMIIAHRDPGRPNWLDTEGRPFGIMFWRFQLPEEPIAPLDTEVITLG
jgi:hypothetical protein